VKENSFAPRILKLRQLRIITDRFGKKFADRQGRQIGRDVVQALCRPALDRAGPNIARSASHRRGQTKPVQTTAYRSWLSKPYPAAALPLQNQNRLAIKLEI